MFYCSSCDPGATNCDGDCQWNYKFEKCVPNCRIDKNCNRNEKCSNEKCVPVYPNCRTHQDCQPHPEECKDEKCVKRKSYTAYTNRSLLKPIVELIPYKAL